MSQVLLPGFAILAVCLFVRLSVTCLTCWDFTTKEKIFVCCTWTPKSIVEVILIKARLLTVTLSEWSDNIEPYVFDITVSNDGTDCCFCNY